MRVLRLIESREPCAEAGWYAYDFLLDGRVDEPLIRALGALGSLAYLPMLRRPFFKVESHHFLIKGMQGDDFFRMAVHGECTAELDRVRALVETAAAF